MQRIKKKIWKSIILSELFFLILGGGIVPLPLFGSEDIEPFKGNWIAQYHTRFEGFKVIHTPTAVIIHNGDDHLIFTKIAVYFSIGSEIYDPPVRLPVNTTQEAFEWELGKYNLVIPTPPPILKKSAPPPTTFRTSLEKKDQ